MESSKGKSRSESHILQVPQLDGPSSASSGSSATPPPGAGLMSGGGGIQPRITLAGTSEEINSELDDSDSEGEASEEEESGNTKRDIVFCTYDKVCVFSQTFLLNA